MTWFKTALQTPHRPHTQAFVLFVVSWGLVLTRGGIRFLKNRIYPVFRAILFKKSVLMAKKCRFALRKHENRPFFAIFAIFGNSDFSQPTIRHTPNVVGLPVKGGQREK